MKKNVFIKQFYFLLLLPMLSFGFNVGDTVWNDVNQDWEQNVGEIGYPNVTVELYNDVNQKIQTTQTDANGKYEFKNVSRGEYVVKLVPSAGVSLVTLNNVELWVEKDRVDIDFGITTENIVIPSTYTVGDRVWNDVNQDWEQNQGEQGLANVEVELYDAQGLKIQTEMTDVEGKYAFTDVAEGEYVVKIILKAGQTLVTSNNIELWVEQNRTDIDFGVFGDANSNTEGVTINEVLAANASINLDADYKQFSDWIELYNNEDHVVDIGGYYLSDDAEDLEKWYIPQGTKIAAHSYLVIWADKEDDSQLALHTNFKLSQKGDGVFFSNEDGVLVDSVKFLEQERDISCAKVDNKIVYMVPTPNAANSEVHTTAKRSKKPKFSLDSGFYNGAQALELTQENGGIIYYTTDGSIPTEQSTQYTQPINVNKTMIVRTRGFENGKFLSSIKNRTYLINENITLPVVSIGINDEYLNDNEIGIYANYDEKWMRAGSIEYIKDGKSEFSENVGIRLSGNYTRQFAQKSLSIYAKSQFGPKSIKYKLFRDKPEIKKVKSFVLRNSGNDWGYTMMKDGLVHSIVKNQMDIDYQSYEPTIVFINGQYWGIHNLREKKNEDYLEANHGVEADDVDILEDNAEINEGSNLDYLALINYIKTHSLENDTYYKKVLEEIDVDEYINYMITEIYGGNGDWPYTNIRFWKEEVKSPKWRWILYDTDRTFEDYERNTFSVLLDPIGQEEPNPAWSTFLFRSLMKNATFKQKFISTFKTHLDTTFKPERVSDIITSLKSKIEPEIDRHFEKWPRRDPSNWETGLSDSIADLHDFALNRTDTLNVQLNAL